MDIDVNGLCNSEEGTHFVRGGYYYQMIFVRYSWNTAKVGVIYQSINVRQNASVYW